VAPVTCAEGTGKNRCSADVNKTVGIKLIFLETLC